MIRPKVSYAVMICCLVVFVSHAPQAALIGPEISRGSIEFLVAPVFDAGDEFEQFVSTVQPSNLLSPGGFYPGRVNNDPTPPIQTIGGTLFNPTSPIHPAALSATANPLIIDIGHFGAAQTTLVAKTVGLGGGVFWENTTVMDSSPDGFASLNQSRGMATFHSTFATFVIAGVWVAYTGTVPAGGFGAIGIQGQFRFGTDPPLDPIAVVLASDVNGSRDPYMSMHGAISQIIEFPDTNTFLAMGINFAQGFIPEGDDAAALDVALTLIADPGTTLTPAAFTPGFLAGVPPELRPLLEAAPVGAGIALVPEPSTILLLAFGFMALLSVSRRAKQKLAQCAATAVDQL